MTTDPMTIDDFFDSLTGTEEESIETTFGTHLSDLLLTKGAIKFSRAVLFVMKTREGLSYAEAKKAVMAMTRKQMNEQSETYFVEDDPGDVDEDDPQSDLGKDEGSSD